MQSFVDSSLCESDRGSSAEPAASPGAGFVEVHGPFPPGGAARLDDLILYVSVLHGWKTTLENIGCGPVPDSKANNFASPRPARIADGGAGDRACRDPCGVAFFAYQSKRCGRRSALRVHDAK
jgi:hypothetical protein